MELRQVLSVTLKRDYPMDTDALLHHKAISTEENGVEYAYV